VEVSALYILLDTVVLNIVMNIFINVNRFRYSFICQGTSTRRQWSDLFGLWVKLPPVTISLTTQR